MEFHRIADVDWSENTQLTSGREDDQTVDPRSASGAGYWSCRIPGSPVGPAPRARNSSKTPLLRPPVNPPSVFGVLSPGNPRLVNQDGSRMLQNCESDVEQSSTLYLPGAGGVVAVAGTVPAEFQRVLCPGILRRRLFPGNDQVVDADGNLAAD